MAKKIAKLARRTFLFGSVAVTGGVLFGIYTVRQPHDNPLLDELEEGAATFNPWVKVTAEAVTLIAPHTDIGQGIRSLQAALIAEELDIDPADCIVETGRPAAAYFNTAMAAEGVPFPATDDSLVANAARGVVGAAIKVLGVQVTGGSSSVPDSFEKLRVAGAVARETLKLAAAEQAGVPADRLSTADGAVRLPDGGRIAYTALAGIAAGIEPPAEVALRSPRHWRLLGKPMQRLDIVAKSTGSLAFGIDLRMDGMLNAAVRLNPRRGGPLLDYDAGAAKSMPGVRRILPVSNGVAVVADNTWNAFQAADAVDIRWGDAPYPADMEAHWQAVEAAFVDDRLDRTWRDDGDVEQTLAAADKPLSLEYRAPYVAHAPLEPLNAVARYTDKRIDLWVSHQMPRFAQQLVAKITGLDEDAVHIHNQYAGGSFGHRLEFDNVRYAAEIAQQMPGTPIKLTFSREEDFAQDYVRQIAMGRVEGSVRDGRIESLSVDIAAPSVMASQMPRAGAPATGPDRQLPAGVWEAPYALEHFRCRAYRVPELAPVSSWRSVGASTGGFFLESAFDELCVAAGADPLEERLRLCSDPLARRVLEAVGDMASWGDVVPDGRGRGLALVRSFGVYAAEVVDVTNTNEGIRIDRVFVALDVGPVLDPVNFENQVQGGVAWGLGHAMNCEITYVDGQAEQRNYHQHSGLRIAQCPAIEVRALETSPTIRGVGEPPVPPAAPALANAIHAATGRRLRQMPFHRFVRFA